MSTWFFRSHDMASKNTTLKSQFTPEEIKAWKAHKAKNLGRNTFQYTKDGETITRLHETDIVWTQPDGSHIIRVPERYRTHTTKQRINAIIGNHLYCNKRSWWFQEGSFAGAYTRYSTLRSAGIKSAWHLHSQRIPFFNGIQLPTAFEIPNTMSFDDRHAYWRDIYMRFMEENDRFCMRYCIYHPQGGVPIGYFIRGQALNTMRVIDNRVHEIVTLSRRRVK